MDDEDLKLILNKIELQSEELPAILESVLVATYPYTPKEYDYIHIAENFAEMRRNLVVTRGSVANSVSFGYGWYPLVSGLWDKIMHMMLLDSFHSEGEETELSIGLYQLKEKFGGLRFYYNMIGLDEVAIDIIQVLVSDCEHRSYSICEVCGDARNSKTRTNLGWYKTLCDLHYEESLKLHHEESLEKRTIL
jgi:hypothetical protein